MKIEVLSTSHNAPPSKNLSQYFIRGVVKKRLFNSEGDILRHYNKECNQKDIIRASSDVRYTMQDVHIVVKIIAPVGDDGIKPPRFTCEEVKIKIPAFFVYDGLSIGVFQILASRQSRLAGMVHDWLYYSGKYDKETCDKIMRAVQIYRGNNIFTTEIYYLGVEWFGKSSYQQYRLK